MTNLTSRVREQGVALMMTLGILSLILILAMSFAFTARTNRMLSQTNADMTRARLLAKSALERVIADLGYTHHPNKYIVDDTGTVSSDDRSRIYPATAASGVFDTGVSDYEQQHVWISKAADGDSVRVKEALTCMAGVPGKGRFPELTDSDLSGISAGWKHTKEYRKQLDDTFRKELVGRISFAVIGESGKIDPVGVLTVNQEPYWGTTAADGFFDLDGDGSPDAFKYEPASFVDWNETKIPRLGLSPQEIRLHSDYAEGFWKSLPKVGDRAADWFSWRHIAAGLTADGSTLLMTDSTRAEMLEEYFPYSYDCESYMYVDVSATDTTPVEKHRTNLWALDWESTEWLSNIEKLYWIGAYPADDILPITAKGPSNFRDVDGNIPDANTIPDRIPAANAVGGVPALGQIGDKDDLGKCGPIMEATLVNMVDNADLDNEASVLPDGNEWDIRHAGCEIQPYLNEIGFEITYLCEPGTDGLYNTPDDPKTGTVSIMMYLELAEIYGTPRPFHANARITYYIEHYNAAGVKQSARDFKVNKIIAFEGGVAGDNAYTVAKLAAPHIFDTFLSESTPPVPDAPAQVRVTITNFELNLRTDDTTGTVFADYARPIDADTAPVWAMLDGQAATIPAYISVQADDPRCNTLSTFWTPHGTNAGFASTDVDILSMKNINTAPTGEKNDGVDPSDGSSTPLAPFAPINTYVAGEFDAETVTDPVSGLSSAYIANKPNFTFWELGAVHRGQPWRTINLHAFTKLEEGVSPIMWRSYADGDAAILTQAKLGGFTETRGKVNANSSHAGTWYQLLNGINVGGTHAGTGGATLSDPQAKADAIVKYFADSDDRFLERGEIVRLPALTAGPTDREQEELVCKLANLLTVRQNLFSVMVTAQAVKDTGINDAGLYNTVEYDETNKYFCNILAEQRLLATVYRDAFTNIFRVVRVEYLED